MGLFGRVWREIASIFRESRIEEEIADEMRVHLARLTAYNRRAGLSPEEAAREARRRLGAAWVDPQGRQQRTPQPARYHAA
jgi:hypothetical protein